MKFFLIQALSEDTTQLFGPYPNIKFAEAEVEQIKTLQTYHGYTFHILGHVPGEKADGFAPLYPAWSDESLDLDINYVIKAKKRAEKERCEDDNNDNGKGKKRKHGHDIQTEEEGRVVPVPVVKKIKRTRQPSDYNRYVGIRIKVLVVENEGMPRKKAFQQAAKDWSSLKKSYNGGKIPKEKAAEIIEEQTKLFEELASSPCVDDDDVALNEGVGSGAYGPDHVSAKKAEESNGEEE